jgi:hypothetical protein
MRFTLEISEDARIQLERGSNPFGPWTCEGEVVEEVNEGFHVQVVSIVPEKVSGP